MQASQVVVKDNRFQPVAVEVPAGTEVTWSFQDGGTPHDVTGDGWKSGKAQPRAPEWSLAVATLSRAFGSNAAS
jgi:plastocyanin